MSPALVSPTVYYSLIGLSDLQIPKPTTSTNSKNILGLPVTHVIFKDFSDL